MASVGDSGRNRRGELRLVDGGARRQMTGEELLRGAARAFADYITRWSPDVPEDDPGLLVAEDLCAQHRALAG